MPRYKLLIEYDGTPYVGWQRQANGRAVQQVIEEAILAFCGEDLRIQGAGRTDAGVHATGQVATVTLAKAWRVDVVRDAINAYLALSDELISIMAAERVDDDFDARFSARGRRYLYRPRVPRDAALRRESRSFLSRVFGGAVAPAVVHLLEQSDLKLTPREIEQLRAILESGEERDKGTRKQGDKGTG